MDRDLANLEQHDDSGGARVAVMSWERDLFAVLDDLEGQAQAAFAAEREAELADRARAEYGAVSLASRLMASVGTSVSLDLPTLGRVEGTLQRVGEGWCLLDAGGQDWVVPLRHVVSVHGASQRSVPEVAWSPVSRLGLRSALRRLADSGAPCQLCLGDGSRPEVRVERVGADFLEVMTASHELVLVPHDTVVAIRSRAEA